eukprot:366502-Chlamydomonas_euryale.AAC.11
MPPRSARPPHHVDRRNCQQPAVDDTCGVRGWQAHSELVHRCTGRASGVCGWCGGMRVWVVWWHACVGGMVACVCGWYGGMVACVCVWYGGMRVWVVWWHACVGGGGEGTWFHSPWPVDLVGHQTGACFRA